MALKMGYMAAVLAVGTATAIGAAPIAAAAPASGQSPAAVATSSSSDSGPAAQQSCTNLGGTQSLCQSPGDVQLNDAPPQVDYYPYAGGAT